MRWRSAALLAVAETGSAAAVQQVLTVRDRRKYPAPGLLVHVDGRQIHLQVRGADSAGPTVVLEAGMGSFSPNWYWVQEELAPLCEASVTTVPGLAGAVAAAIPGTPRPLRWSCVTRCGRPRSTRRTCSRAILSAAFPSALSQIFIRS